MKIDKIIKNKPYIIAGPCSCETEHQVLQIAKDIQNITDVFRAGIWKPRTKPSSFEGVGEKGLKWLQTIQKETSLKVATEVANTKHVEKCLEAKIDMIWIGARTTVNPFYVQEIAESLRGVNIPVFVKNPIHPELRLWIGALERLNKVGICKLIAIHRGFFSYEKTTFRNDPKWEMPIKLREEVSDIPIICDPSHISGNSNMIAEISQTAMDLNFDGLMIETHNLPKNALSDKNQQVTPKELNKIVNNLLLRIAVIEDKFLNFKLKKFRSDIDNLDKLIVNILSRRKEIVEKIAYFKNKNQISIFQLERWFEILRNRRIDALDLGMNEKMIKEIFTLIHKYSIIIQTEIMKNANEKKLENKESK